MEETLDDEGWTSTSFIDGHKQTQESASKKETSEAEEIIDIDLDDEIIEDDEDINTFSPDSTPTRSYNLYISYSTSYRVPKFYLSGFNSQGIPLTPEEMFEDIMADYRNKTATIEKAPFEDDMTLVSIHPCRHASVMKTFLAKAEHRLPRNEQSNSADNADDWEEIKPSESQHAIRVDQYLIVFLKFIASVTPGIEHDNTMSVL